MAEILVGVAGAAVGFSLGGPAGAWKGFQIGYVLGSVLFPPGGPSLDQGRLDELRLQSAQQGTPIPIMYGRNRVGGTVIWASGLKETVSTSSVGGKGGGGGTSTSYTYSTSLAILVCEGPISSVRRIWANEKVIYDSRGGSPVVADWVNLSKVRIYDGTQTLPDAAIEAAEGVGNVPAHKGMCYVVFEDLGLGELGNSIPNFTFEVEPAYSDLKAVMDDLASKVGLVSTDYDFSALSGMLIRGFVIAARTEAARAMDSLAKANFFEIVETGGKIKAVIRTGVSALSIPSDDIGASADEEAKAWIETARAQEVELPREFNVSYNSEAQDFQTFTQVARRTTRFSQNQESTTFPMSLSDEYARYIADAFLMEVWVSRTVHSFTLPYRYLYLDPGDVVSVIDEAGGSRSVRILEMNAGLLAQIEIKAVDDDPIIYVDPGLPAAVPTSSTGAVVVATPADLLVFETTAPTDGLADSPQLGYAAARPEGGWKGGRAETTPNIRAYQGSFTSSLGEVPSNSTMGYSVAGSSGVLGFSNLPDGTSIVGRLDTVNKVRVTLVAGALASVTFEDMVAGGQNLAVLGREMFQFQTANLISGTTYELSNLLRFRRGTDYLIAENTLYGGGHASGEGFVLLNSGAFAFAYAPQEISITHSFRMIETSRDYSGGLPSFLEPLTLKGLARKPYAPSGVKWTGDRTSGTADVTLSWTRRARKGGDLVNYIDAPLDEASEAYEVEIWDNSFSTLLRTISGIMTPSVNYAVAIQTLDGVQASPFGVRVYQVSSEAGIGRGFGTLNLVGLSPSVIY